MIDLNLIRKNPEIVRTAVLEKGSDVDVSEVIALDNRRRNLIVQVEHLRQQRNVAAQNKNIEKGREVKKKLEELENKLEETEKKFNELVNAIPNIPFEDVPFGQDERGNVVVRKWGEPPRLNFPAKDHVELGKILDIIDFESGSTVSGSGFYYLKNEGALLEIALINYGLRFLTERGFTVMITPDLAREKFYLGTGYLPKGEEAQTYKIEDSDLGLIATAEVTLAGYHADKILDVKNLPQKFGGYSHCFRMESGAYGKYSKGLYRVHQFSKVEMFAFTAVEQSIQMHQEFLKHEEDFWQSLGIPYRVVEMCTGDLGAQAAKKFDLEAWMPGRGEYGEITSTSNTTDYQSRNLGTRYREENGQIKYAHTLNGTLVATSRGIIAILENFQQEDGSVKIPEVLIPYTTFSEIKPK